VGFDLYTKLLHRAVSEMKSLRDGTPAPSMPLTGVNIDLPLQAHLPAEYVGNDGLRLQLYRRMGNINSAQEIDALAQELTDRFGPPPKAVENLMFQLHLKVLAAQAQVSAIVRDRERNNIVLKCEALEHMDRFGLQKRLGNAAAVQRREVHIVNDDTWRIKLVKVLQELGG
jgi:transcription-repair coupling factor (superfamily II helicase)